MRDLIERDEVLRVVEAMCGGAAADEVRKALPLPAALSPGLPEDVKSIVIRLNNNDVTVQHDAANLIERLALTKSFYDLAIKERDYERVRCDNLQQRIEGLECAFDDEEASHKETLRMLKIAQQRIDELERIRRMK